MDRVLQLSDRLRDQGVDCKIDQYEQSPAKGWPRWCAGQVKEADFVLVVCTETYKRRFEANEEPDKGKGVTFEGFVAIQEIYEAQSKNEKFVPILLQADDSAYIPELLKAATRYNLSASDGYELLYRRLTKQPYIKEPPLGDLRALPPRDSPAPATFPVAASTPLPKLEPKRDFASRPSNIPPVPSPYFTGRQAILEKVREELAQSKRVALSGMRGVGKTQVARQYAQSHRKEYPRIFWARAEKPETLIADFGSIAQLLGLPEKDQEDQSIIVAAVKSWLETDFGWLLILDNADEISLVQDFVPGIHEGHVLLTTTASYFGGWAEKVPVEHMDQDEGTLLLLRRVNLIPKDGPLDAADDKDRILARNLAHDLGGLPLALDQAGAYIDETPSTLSEYHQLYQKEGKRLRAQRGDFGKDHPSVTVTFSLAFSELAKRDPLAADMVRLCAFLAPDAIPEEIFTKGGSALGEEFARRAENPLDFTDTVKQAAKFSLIRRDASDRSLDIHRLIQEVLKDEMGTVQLREWTERAIRAVNLVFPGVEFRNWPECERLLPHAKACAALIEEFSFEFAEAARLLNETALYMENRAQYGEAEPLHQRALAIREKALGPEHPDVAISLNNLAAVYEQQGRYTEAEPVYQRALRIWEKALGPEHPNVAISLNNLAGLYDNQERYAEAEPLYQRSLAIWEKALGPDHPDAAASLNNLALLYYNQERYAEAEPFFQRALAMCEKALGPQHPRVAASLNNLAGLYKVRGRYAEAEPLYRRSLMIAEKALGPEHPDVANSLNNLAGLYKVQGRHAEAEPLYQRSLVIHEKALGPDHPYVAAVLECYADLLRKTGRDTEARPLETRAKAVREK